MSQPDLEKFALTLLEEVRVNAEASGCDAEEAFTGLVLDQFNAEGHAEDAVPVRFKEHGAELSGFGRSSDDRCIDLYLTIYSPRADGAHTMDRSTVEAAFKRLENLVVRSLSGTLLPKLNPGSDIAGVCATLHKDFGSVEKLRLVVATNARSVLRDQLPAMSLEGRPVTRELWDLGRLANWASSGNRAEPIVAEFPEAIPCLETQDAGTGYSVILAIVPGPYLAGLYSEHGGRLLELNVRSFLQTRGGVNKGIQETLRKDPQRFLAYNNGISATASHVEFDDTMDGRRLIRRIHDLQIVNGGQTTASIHHAHRNRVDISSVQVQMKLTVVSADQLDSIVPQISAYSNTQNKVTASDLKANSSFHVQIEQIMRTLWAPASVHHPHDTHWFYERARGQYANAVSASGTPARQKLFKATNPAGQKFVKSDVAKFEHSWAMLPHEVSRGAEKNFALFAENLDNHQVTLDKEYCRHLVAKAILFRGTDKIVAEQSFGGYKINIVTYTIAKLVHATGGCIDLDRIWREQDLSPALREAVTELSQLVQKVITSPPDGKVHVGEWAKKVDCWIGVRSLDWTAPAALRAELAAHDTYTENLRIISSVAPVEWAALGAWGEATGLFDSAKIRVAVEIGHALESGSDPVSRHAGVGVALLSYARAQGYPIGSTER